MVRVRDILLNIFIFTLLAILFTSCLNGNDEKLSTILKQRKRHADHSLERVMDRDTLIAITDYNSTNYFIYRGEPMGYQYEMLKQFSEHLGIKLRLVVLNDVQKAFKMLNKGEVDLIAMGLTITQARQKIVDFTIPQLQTKQVLVQRKPENWRKMRTWDEIEAQLIRNPLDLANKTVYVQKGTIFADRLAILANEIGDSIHVVQDQEREVEQLITAVAKGEIDFTVADEHIAKVNEKYYPNIDVNTALSFPQHVAWAVKHGSDSLRMTINDWIQDYKKSVASRYTYDKYFNNPRSVNIAQSEYYSIGGGKISQYDDIIRELSEYYDLDWRLVASLIYQESRFHPEATSWVGAFGLMQLMPSTAEKFGVDSASSASDQIRAGIEFLLWLDSQLPPEIKDPEQRMRFTLAAYNVGIAHIYDARRLAEKHGKDPNIWTDNVDYYILNKSNPVYYRDSVVRYGYARGEETYNFVTEILERYELYKKVIEN